MRGGMRVEIDERRPDELVPDFGWRRFKQATGHLTWTHSITEHTGLVSCCIV